ncbi:Helicase MOV-10 [Rhodotorula kratochvilovae]
MSTNGPPSLCTVCRIIKPTRSAYDDHLACEGHQRREVEGSPGVPQAPPGYKTCAICPAVVVAGHWQQHEAGRKHQSLLRFARFQAAAEQAASPQHGVELLPAGGLDFGLVEFQAFTAATQHSNIVNVLTLKAGPRGCTVVGFTISDRQAVVPGNSERRLPLHFHPRNEVGSFDDALLLTISVAPPADAAQGTKPDRFVLRCPVRGKVGCKQHIDTFAATEPFVPKKALKRRPRATKVVPAPRFGGKAGYLRPLDALKISGAMRHVLENEKEPHPSRLKTLNAHSYDLENVPLKQHGRQTTYFLTVPGLAEKRPSVLRGDAIRVRPSGGNGVWHEGRAVEIRLLEVGLRFSHRFTPSPSARFDVQFVPPPTTTRRQLTALSHADLPSALLFPSQDPADYPPRRPLYELAAQRDFFDPALEVNPEQRDAVLSIVHGSSGAYPFILFGPPGTGKTTTLVEAVKQLVAHNEAARLLITAPSNAAADLFCLKLGLSPHELLRLNAPTRFVEGVDAAVRAYSPTAPDEFGEVFAVPTLGELKEFRVVVTTCVTAFTLWDRGMEKGHFTHIVVDEAGQATEPEAFVPISLAGPDTRVVLAGDPKQLGPVVQSPFAERYGLGTSLLERFMSLPIYADGNDSMRGVSYIKLLRNYRSHRAILSFPNGEFYRNELVAVADARVTGRLARWSGWPARDAKDDFPVMFHAVRGEDEREGRSPSFFNVAEITVVAAYVEALLHSSEGLDLAEKDIGVIPYRSQAEKLREAINRSEVTVGSVEQFQGAERSCIIISTVRSNEQYLSHDARFSLGFIAHPKRLNVALTRAQAGLIVVGNPEVLALDPLWRRFLLYVHDHGGWTGEAWDADAARRDEFDPVGEARARMDDLTRTLAGLGLGGESWSDESGDESGDDW